MRSDGLLGDVVPVAGRGAVSRPVARFDPSRHVKGQGEVIGNDGVDIRAEVEPVVIEAFDIPILGVVAQGDEILDLVGTPGGIDVQVGVGADAESLLIPVGIVPSVGRIVVGHHFNVRLREDGGIAVHLPRLVVPVGITRCVEHFEHQGVGTHAIGAREGDPRGSRGTALGGDNHHRVGIQSVHRCRRGILQYRDGSDFVRVDFGDAPLDAVDDVFCRGASNDDAGAVGPRLSRLLEGDDARDDAPEHVGDIPGGPFEEFLATDGADRPRDAAPLLGAVTYDHHFVNTFALFSQNDVDRFLVSHRHLYPFVADKGEDQGLTSRGQVEGKLAVCVRSSSRSRPLDDDGRSGERQTVLVGHRPSHQALCPGDRCQQQQDRYQGTQPETCPLCRFHVDHAIVIKG